MLRFLFYLAIVIVGGVLALNYIPSLKANIIEVVNPRMKETRLLGDLQRHLDDAAALLPEAGEQASDDDIAEGYEALQKAQEVLDEVTTINEENSGTARNIVTKALDAILPGGTVPTPVPDVPSSVSPVPCVP
ncbi:MAG TPA: hypothetical protein VJ553_03670 [Candidatus Paceibacterota bacterium]|nr:hypothetical protein [Candidatus Paceibacterota bacterium]